MREPKLFWRDVPQDLRDQISEMIGSQIHRAHRVFGGYGPSATFRIFMKDGRTILAKGAGKGSISGNWEAIPNEERASRHMDAIHSMWKPQFGWTR